MVTPHPIRTQGGCLFVDQSFLVQAHPLSNHCPALHRMEHPRYRHSGDGVPVSFLVVRLASIWPDRGNTWNIQNKSNNGPNRVGY